MLFDCARPIMLQTAALSLVRLVPTFPLTFLSTISHTLAAATSLECIPHDKAVVTTPRELIFVKRNHERLFLEKCEARLNRLLRNQASSLCSAVLALHG